MNWIDALLSRIAELWPFARVRTWERGVRFRYWPWLKEPSIEEVGPGVWFAFWWFEEVMSESVVQQTKNLPTQSITTKDDVSVSFSMNFLYEVTDIRAKFTKVHDFEESLVNLAMIHLAKRVRRVPWEYLRGHQATLERRIRRAIERQANQWGVKIVDVGLTDMVKAKQWRVYGDPPMLKFG